MSRLSLSNRPPPPSPLPRRRGKGNPHSRGEGTHTRRDPEKAFGDLVRLMARLRGRKGCPWDKKQNHRSLKPYLIEETYEVIDAINSGKPPRLREELGDLLLQIVFHTRVAQEAETFDLRDVIVDLLHKMKSRHPHVFGKKTLRNPEKALHQWYRIKRKEQKAQGAKLFLEGIPKHLPALQKAQKVQRKVSSVGFDWPSTAGILRKIDEELREVRVALRGKNEEESFEEIGDLLFSVANLSRFLHLDSEQALHQTVAKFTRRFHAVEEELDRRGIALEDSNFTEMDRIWNAVKKREG